MDAQSVPDNVKPKLEELMLVMDAVDTIRHESMFIENELLSEERRGAIKVRMRQHYLDNGLEVSDETIERAIDELEKKRFGYKPLENGIAKTLAMSWVNRAKIAKRISISVAAGLIAVLAFNSGYDAFIEKPRLKAIAELKLELETRLPKELKEAHLTAVATAAKFEDETSKSHADNLRDTAQSLIAAEKIKEARTTINSLHELSKSLEAKATIIKLTDEYEIASKNADDKSSNDTARKSLDSYLSRLKVNASGGEVSAFNKNKAEFETALYRVSTPLEIHIVDRNNVSSGVWRSQNGGLSKVYYIIVEAVDPSGNVVPMPIRSVETGKTTVVSHWGVRVPEREYNRVGKDKSDGIIDAPEAGFKPAGSLEYEWSIPTEKNQMITSW